MAHGIQKLATTTAIALALSAAAQAQPYDSLAGVMVPSCEPGGEPVDAGTLEAEAFDGEYQIPIEFVKIINSKGELCLNAEGVLELSGTSAAMAGRIAGAAEPAPEADATAEAEPAAEPASEPTQTTEPAAEVTESTQSTGEATVEGTATATVETLAQELIDQGRTEQPVEEAPSEQPATTAEIVEPAPEADTIEQQQPVAAAAEAGSDGGQASEAAEVSETVVTEENSRSSSEEFADRQGNAAASSGGSDGGLSNLEKFALGAAGIIALEAIVGNNREVVSNSGDRVVLRDQDGDLEVLRDDDMLLRRPGSEVRTETFSDGSTRTTVTRANGGRIVTIADAAGRVIKRTRITPDGREILIIDDTADVQPVDVSRLPPPQPERRVIESNDRDALQAALRSEAASRLDRRFTLRQVREYRQIRDLMPEISIDAINFETGSAAIQPEEAEELLDLGQALSEFIADNPDELFLVEGHTDAVGGAAGNLALSDRRAESVALALTEYFGVPPENMIIQGYGEFELLVPTEDAERANRRAVVRRVTPLLR